MELNLSNSPEISSQHDESNLDFVSEIFNNEPLSTQNKNLDMNFSICSDFSNFGGDFWSKTDPVYFNNKKQKQPEIASTNDEMALGNEDFFANLLNEDQDKYSFHNPILPPKSRPQVDNNTSIFVENDLKIDEDDLNCQFLLDDKNINMNSSIHDMFPEVTNETQSDPTKDDFAKIDINFRNLENILCHIFIGDEVYLSAENKLNYEEKWIVEQILLKTFRKDIKFHDYNYNIKYLIMNIRKKKSKRSSEELIKKIYRPFLRTKFENFKKRYISVKETLKFREFGANMYDDKIKSFFCDLFIDLNRTSEKDFNLYMDILTERTKSLVYSSKTLKKSQNWQKITKAKFPSKISKSLRYLVSKNPATKAQFLKYIDSHYEHNLSNIIINKIAEDLKNKLNATKNLYFECDQNFDLFTKKFGDLIHGRSFKLQWPFWEIKEALKFCKIDLENPKLKLEFDRIREKHYSYIE